MIVMMEEKTRIRRFVCEQLRAEPDLSTLTLGILKKRYLAHMKCDSLSSESKGFMKEVVSEELMKMQDDGDSGQEVETKKPQNKRKREKENVHDGVINGAKDESESRAKKSRRQPSSTTRQPSVKKSKKSQKEKEQAEELEELDTSNIINTNESDDKEDGKTERRESEEEEDVASGSEHEEQEVKKSQEEIKEKSKPQTDSEDSSKEEDGAPDRRENDSGDSDSPKEVDEKKENTTENGKTGSSDESQGNKTPQSEEENESDSDSKSEKSVNMKDSSDDSEKEDKAPEEKKKEDSDSDSSSLPSLEDEPDVKKENKKDDKKKKKEDKAPVEKKKEDSDSDSDSSSLPSLEDEPDVKKEKKKDDKKKKKVKKEERTGSKKDDDKAVTRLRRYITLCGVRLQYKKLLEGCKSVRSQVAVLKRELEELGVHGQPSIKKCKKVRMEREQAQEVAELDTNNIITTNGRPKRRGAWREPKSPVATPHVRALNSSSDSDEENSKQRGGRRGTDWTNLKGIISDDADSD